MGEKRVRSFLVRHQKSWLRNLRCRTFSGSTRKVYYETFSTEPCYLFRKKFISKPLVRNLFGSFQAQVLCETTNTELLFCVHDNGFVEHRNFHETKKGSSRVSRGRTILSSVKFLFFLKCSFFSLSKKCLVLINQIRKRF